MSSFTDPTVLVSYVTTVGAVAIAVLAKSNERANRTTSDDSNTRRRRRRRTVDDLAAEFERENERIREDHRRELQRTCELYDQRIGDLRADLADARGLPRPAPKGREHVGD